MGNRICLIYVLYCLCVNVCVYVYCVFLICIWFKQRFIDWLIEFAKFLALCIFIVLLFVESYVCVAWITVLPLDYHNMQWLHTQISDELCSYIYIFISKLITREPFLFNLTIYSSDQKNINSAWDESKNATVTVGELSADTALFRSASLPTR